MNHRRSAIAWSAALLLFALGCQETATGNAAAPASTRKAKAAAAVPATDATSEGALAVSLTDARAYVYDPIGKRDPFRSFVLDRVKEVDKAAKGPLEQFDLSQLSVTGVVWEGGSKRALVIDPSGRAYIVQEGDRVGKNEGLIITIGDSEMMVREKYEDFHGEQTEKEIVMRIRLSEGG
ncbi:MAG: pilus assembly protein PilP [Deltaproteobacteria bacterium]|nr:pilus assembly protein PilP [Deltaproteobacteria bacterium]